MTSWATANPFRGTLPNTGGAYLFSSWFNNTNGPAHLATGKPVPTPSGGTLTGFDGLYNCVFMDGHAKAVPGTRMITDGWAAPPNVVQPPNSLFNY